MTESLNRAKFDHKEKENDRSSRKHSDSLCNDPSQKDGNCMIKINTRDLSYDRINRVFACEASDFGPASRFKIYKIIIVQSEKTGREVEFSYQTYELDNESEIVYWKYAAVIDNLNYELLVFND